MNVKVIGNGHSWTNRTNTCFMVNNEMLIDTPQGSSKAMLGYVDFTKIKYVLITHFHSDHFIELHLICDYFRNNKLDHKVKIIGPKTLLKRLLKIYKLTDTIRTKKSLEQRFEFVELNPGKNIQFDTYKITTYKTDHNLKYSLGYVVSDGEVKVGFTGDTSMGKGLIEIIDSSETIFIDTSGKEKSNKHLCVSEVKEIIKKYPSKKFYSVHVSDETLKDKQLDIPKCNQDIEIKKQP